MKKCTACQCFLCSIVKWFTLGWMLAIAISLTVKIVTAITS